MKLKYQLCDTLDPEERLEDAALFKAFHDASNGAVTPVAGSNKTELCDFGRRWRHDFRPDQFIEYWTDPAFLSNCGREFGVFDLAGADAETKRLHTSGKGAFIKACRSKYMTLPVPVGVSFGEAMEGMEYSFIDLPPCLMVQELVDFTFEFRLFVFDRKIITYSPAAYHLTPIDYPLPAGRGYRKQASTQQEAFDNTPIIRLAEKVATTSATPTFGLDIGMIGDRPAVVEFNPFIPGQIGLFASDVRSIASAFWEAMG